MEYGAYLSSKDVNGKNLSYDEILFYIRIIYNKYGRESILGFLGHIGSELNFNVSKENIFRIQNNFGINEESILIHPRAVLTLGQIFLDTSFTEPQCNSFKKIETLDIFWLFLYANHILNKTDKSIKHENPDKVSPAILMAFMRMFPGTLNSNEVFTSTELFIKFYKKLLESQNFELYNSVVISNTKIDINEFIKILEDFMNHTTSPNLFSKFENFIAPDLDTITTYWNNRIPKLSIPFEYRFFETYPLIKYQAKFYTISVLLIFMATVKKIYHVLSNDSTTKSLFRSEWGKSIVEPVVKKYFKEIFETTGVTIVDEDLQEKYGFEIADIIMVYEDDIYLMEIKSGYMALEHRYSDDESIFAENFDKKYIYNTSGKHQQINQIKIFDGNYPKISKFLKLNNSKKYKVFSCLLAFDEGLMGIGFNRYLSNRFNDELIKLSQFKNIIPFKYSNLLTFVELLNIKQWLNRNDKRISLFKNSFIYLDSFSDYVDDIINLNIKVDDISVDNLKNLS